jgi:integrase
MKICGRASIVLLRLGWAAGHSMDTRHPSIRDVMRGLRRAKGVAQGHAEALTVPLLRRLLATCGDRLIDARDRALLLVGFGAALRRSELVALDLDDIAVVPEGLRITIRRSKSDQEGEGKVIAVGRTGTATCPGAAYAVWLTASAITDGAVFRGVDRHGHIGARLSTDAVAGIVRRRAAAAGLEAAVFSGHSMRAGFATSAAAAGIEERLIMRQTRHRSAQTVRRYIRDGALFARNLAQEVGL